MEASGSPRANPTEPAQVPAEVAGQREANLVGEVADLMHLHELVGRLLFCPDLRSALEEVLDAAVQIVGADRGIVQLLSAGNRLRIFAQRGFNQEFLDGYCDIGLDHDTACGRTFRSGQRTIVEDVLADPQYAPYLSIAAAAGYRSVQSTPLMGRNGEVLGILSTHHAQPHRPSQRELRMLDLYARQAADCIERVRANEALSEARSRLQATLAAAEVATWTYDIAADRMTADRNLARLFSVSPADAAGGPLSVYLQAIHPDDRAAVTARVQRSIAACSNYEATYRVGNSDGEYRWVVARGNVECDAHGAPLRLPGVVVDITVQKQTEERLREAAARGLSLAGENAKFRTFFEQGSNFAGVMTLDGTVIEANRLSLEACGFAREQVIGKKFWDCPWWNRSPKLMEMIREATQQAAGGTVFRRESTYFVSDGTQRLVDLIVSPVKDEAGQVLFIAPTGTDITDRKLGEQANKRLAAIVESSDDAIISKDLNSIIMSWNAAATRLFGYSPQEAIGQSITILMPPERVNEEPEILERIRRGERIEHYETVRRRKDGSLVEIAITVSPLTNERGTVVGASKIARDITDRKQAERALLEADRQKNEFLATLAHELRNPLAPIRNSLNILRLSRDDAAAVDHLQEIMERQVNHMVRLVDDLLEIARITTGKIELRLEPVEIASVIRSAVETSKPLIDAGRHRLTTLVPPQTLSVEADPVRLSQVVANLLNNAAKYTEPGGRIWLTVSRDGGEVVISVRDTGIGIAADLLPHVLEMFTQADRTKRNSQDGLGIGLALVKRLVEMHGGSVEARSEGEGRGSEFILRLPLAGNQQQPIDQQAIDQQATIEQPLAARRRILVVDDNQDAAASLAMLLNVLGSDVETAHDGPSALRAFEQFHPHVVLLDLGMPGMSGYEVARCLREKPQFQHVTLVALTGWGQEDDRRRTHAAGFDHHLVKPVNLDALQVLLADG